MESVKGYVSTPRPRPCPGEAGRCPNADLVNYLARKLEEKVS